ncbi:MAG TPA: NrfD/PsrC family molybdoenzyme membrane anchor subunit [Thermoanaerobaculia bacterium]|jgi:formate-dependent nitrite reductase membrane component NrfD
MSEPTYHDLPLLKPPVWTWEIPLYFFIGGAAGAAAVIGFAARVNGAKPSLVRDARWMAAIGATASAPLLISDLGRPERFLNMLRVFKPQSAMSVGVWTLAGFGACATGAVIAPRPLRDVAAAGSALLGLVMSTYTGVLLGVTAIPAWNAHAATLPAHFAASALASATSLLQLRDHDEPALHALATLAAAFEMWTGFQLERRQKPSNVMRTAGVLSGPLPLALRLLGVKSKRARRVAAAITIAGSLVTRFAWVEAGKTSAAQAMRS